VSLVESVRINGKPRQRHIGYLASIRDRRSVDEIRNFWDAVYDKLDGLSDRLSLDDRHRIEAAIAAKVPPVAHPVAAKVPVTHDTLPGPITANILTILTGAGPGVGSSSGTRTAPIPLGVDRPLTEGQVGALLMRKLAEVAKAAIAANDPALIVSQRGDRA
jgi:hypothetical protein